MPLRYIGKLHMKITHFIHI